MTKKSDNLLEEQVIKEVIQEVHKCYDNEQRKLFIIGEVAKTEGEIRDAAGKLVESILQTIFNTLNKIYPSFKINSKIGSNDYLKKEIFYKNKKIILDHIQVDRHIWSDNRRIAFIENKTYLDSCYFDRALADFRKIASALKQNNIDPANVEYVVFAGQDAAKGETLLAYEADFWNDTKYLTEKQEGIEPKVYFFLKGKRSSSKPLYKIKHEIDDSVVKKFTEFIISAIKSKSV